MQQETLKMKMVARSCPVCGSSDDAKVFAQANYDPAKLDEFAFASRKMPEYMHYRLIDCPKCDLLYATPIPEQGAIAEAYHEAAFDSAEEAHFASRTYGRFLPQIKARLRGLLGALDIGTGDGAFLEELLAAGFTQVGGVEPSVAPIKSAKAEIQPLIKHDIFRPQDYSDGSLSLVTCFQTLEHLHDPMEMCHNAHRVLKEGGAVFFIGHNRRAFSAKVLGTKSPIFDIEHLQLFSPKSARAMLEYAGFKDIKLKPIFNLYPLHYWLKLFPLPTSLKRSLIVWLKKLKIGYLPIPLPAGNIAIIGYK